MQTQLNVKFKHKKIMFAPIGLLKKMRAQERILMPKIKVISYGRELLIQEEAVRNYASFEYRNKKYDFEIIRKIGIAPTKTIELDIFNLLEKYKGQEVAI